MPNASEISRAATGATATINQALQVGSAGAQMEALLNAYRLAVDQEAFALALIGALASSARVRRT